MPGLALQLLAIPPKLSSPVPQMNACSEQINTIVFWYGLMLSCHSSFPTNTKLLTARVGNPSSRNRITSIFECCFGPICFKCLSTPPRRKSVRFIPRSCDWYISIYLVLAVWNRSSYINRTRNVSTRSSFLAPFIRTSYQSVWCLSYQTLPFLSVKRIEGKHTSYGSDQLSMCHASQQSIPPRKLFEADIGSRDTILSKMQWWFSGTYYYTCRRQQPGSSGCTCSTVGPKVGAAILFDVKEGGTFHLLMAFNWHNISGT